MVILIDGLVLQRNECFRTHSRWLSERLMEHQQTHFQVVLTAISMAGRIQDDDFPLDPTQFLDYDGDGFGDNSTGNNADACPFQYGVMDGTDGDGCPLVNTDDSDGDGVYNDLDDCENTPLGSIVDATGCSNESIG